MFDDEPVPIPVKWLEPKYYVRVDVDGKPQLVRVEPMVSEDGRIVPDAVALYMDDKGPLVLDRDAVEKLIETSACVPLENVAQWKHKNIN